MFGAALAIVISMRNLRAAAVLAALLLTALPSTPRAQQPDTSLAHNAAMNVARPNATVRSGDSTSLGSRTGLAVVRRQPKYLLAGITLNRSEKKAIYGIIRRNDRALAVLADREKRMSENAAARVQLERDLAAVRDRERAELRAVLNNGQRVRFDQNVARFDERPR